MVQKREHEKGAERKQCNKCKNKKLHHEKIVRRKECYSKKVQDS